MSLSVSRLRENIYRILDEVLETGVPVEIERRGRRLRIVPADRPGKLANLEAHPEYLLCSANDVVELDWSTEWNP